tara:strand:- start:4188 stop:4433 length:246 start_codon:yes stop_codon:yes gene_type:complete
MNIFITRIIGKYILNNIGGSLRWIYGTIMRTILKKPKYTFKEYIYGPKNSEDYFDKNGHGFNNRIIGILFIVIVIGIINEL